MIHVHKQPHEKDIVMDPFIGQIQLFGFANTAQSTTQNNDAGPHVFVDYGGTYGPAIRG
jgi:hypothetical protein